MKSWIRVQSSAFDASGMTYCKKNNKQMSPVIKGIFLYRHKRKNGCSKIEARVFLSVSFVAHQKSHQKSINL